MAGYSGTPLAKKLGIKTGAQIAVLNPPEYYQSLLDPRSLGVTYVSAISQHTDIIHVFATSRTALASQLQRCLARMRDDAVIWASWPKRAAKVPTDITDHVVRAVALPLGLVDIKVCAIDSTWSGLKLVIRRENRRGQR